MKTEDGREVNKKQGWIGSSPIWPSGTKRMWATTRSHGKARRSPSFQAHGSASSLIFWISKSLQTVKINLYYLFLFLTCCLQDLVLLPWDWTHTRKCEVLTIGQPGNSQIFAVLAQFVVAHYSSCRRQYICPSSPVLELFSIHSLLHSLKVISSCLLIHNIV